MTRYNFLLIQGDAKTFNLTFSRGGNPVDITEWTIVFVLSLTGSDVMNRPITVHTDPEAGKSQLFLSSTDTASLSGRYTYSIKVTNGDEQTTTVLVGKMRFIKV